MKYYQIERDTTTCSFFISSCYSHETELLWKSQQNLCWSLKQSFKAEDNSLYYEVKYKFKFCFDYYKLEVCLRR
jgi:hypothetical protein